MRKDTEEPSGSGKCAFSGEYCEGFFTLMVSLERRPVLLCEIDLVHVLEMEIGFERSRWTGKDMRCQTVAVAAIMVAAGDHSMGVDKNVNNSVESSEKSKKR